MRICSLALRNFRNYPSYDLPHVGDLVIFVGPNATGKTNVLESIALITAGTSFRHSQISQLVLDGCRTARIQAQMGDGERLLDFALALEQGKKRFSVNGKSKAAADMKGIVPSVAFTPDHLDLAKKSSSIRRNAIDDLGSQLTRNYHVVRSDYEKALRYKNRLLKDEAPQALVDAMDETLVTCASQLFCYRHALFAKLVPLVARRYGDISGTGEEFSAYYLPSWDYLAGKHAQPSTPSIQGQDESQDIPDDGRYGFRDVSAGVFSMDLPGPVEAEPPAFQEKPFLRENGTPDRDVVRDILYRTLKANRGEERARKRSLVGPHNDKISFQVSGRDAAQFASQGQQRSIVLAWKLAEVEIIRKTLGLSPVLLLDDVMSELDERRRDMLVRNVSDDVQTFITATDLSPFNEKLLEKAQVVRLGQGALLH